VVANTHVLVYDGATNVTVLADAERDRGGFALPRRHGGGIIVIRAEQDTVLNGGMVADVHAQADYAVLDLCLTDVATLRHNALVQVRAAKARGGKETRARIDRFLVVCEAEGGIVL